MNLQQIFLNQYGRLRSGWRFTVFLSSFIFFVMIFGSLIYAVFSALQIDISSESFLFILSNSLISLSLAVLLGWLCGKFFEDLPFRALGAWFNGNWLKDLFLGLLIGTISIGLAVLIAFSFGGLRFHFTQLGTVPILLTLSVSFLVFAAAAAFEEAFFRGYMLQTFARANLAWLAILMTSLFFASAHLQNAGANYISTANTALAGIWFGIAYLKTRNLWFPFGLHFIWNWLQGAIFGIEVSGIKAITTAPLLRETDFGPDWLTGGEYGIEGGIACTVAIIFSSVLIWFAPFLKPTEEMLALTSQEKSVDNI